MHQAVLIIVAFCCTSQIAFAENKRVIEVIAIEYPPFTSSKADNQGIAFELLRAHNQESNISWQANFLPPARAHKLINLGQWCASFYPVKQNNQFEEIQLGSNIVKIGLLRKVKASDFTWKSLNEFASKSVAVLRTNKKSPFVQQFIKANMQIAYTETIEQAKHMVMRNRVDFAIFDNVSFNKLTEMQKRQLQLSQTTLVETPIKVFINPKCNIKVNAQ